MLEWRGPFWTYDGGYTVHWPVPPPGLGSWRLGDLDLRRKFANLLRLVLPVITI